MEYPAQQHKTGTGQRAPVSFREIVDVYTDAAKGGQSNPVYTDKLAANVHAEIIQVSGGEVVRGRQVEGVVSFVVTTRYLPTLDINSKTMIHICSGPHKETSVYAHRVFIEAQRGRPRMLQIHCKSEG